jgi:hypothetical protein
MNHILQHRANAAMAKIETARSPLEKHMARQEGLSVKADLEKRLGDDNALAAFKAAQPQNSFGVWKGAPVHDRPIFMVGPAGTKIITPVALPDGSRATPNPQGQIVVPMPLVPAMIARGFVRANSVITELDTTTPDPAHLQHVL